MPISRSMRLIAGSLVAACGLTAQAVTPEPLKVSYIERPPFYMTQNGAASGLVTEVAARVLTKAKIDFKFVPAGIDRILNDVKANKSVHCSIGFFKTTEREAYAKFSLPIYKSGPVGALVPRTKESLLAKHTTLESLLGDKQLTLGLARAFSYGNHIDGLLANLKPTVVDTDPQHQQLIKMLAHGRISYMIASADEVRAMADAAGLKAEGFVLKPLADAPEPEPRYFMCSKSFSDEAMARLNDAIKSDVHL